ncbi:phosphoglycerate dehydrogenase-like enzyme [Ruminococcaceae bacterium R-25]|nr:phosphoglycerate dehydrogenase-like enzyme [Ruminococcaceae bacterium R-25]SUQ11681.1 Phosphoglycerate dehydrogenase [Oscillospiraceae bacterium]
MKIVVINKLLKEIHKEKIRKAADKAGGDVLFIESEYEFPSDWEDCDIIYGFGMGNAKKNRNLKWLSVPSAGVDYLMKPGVFANEDCLVTNSSGAYGVTIAEHIICVSLMMMRKIDYSYRESLKGNWSLPQPQKSLKDCRIVVLGTGDIGSCFAKRAKAFEPKSITGVSRSGISSDPSYDSVKKVSELDSVLPETDLLVMSLPDTPETRDILSRKRIELLPEGSYVVNVGRGSAIDEDALCESLESGRLGGAALDVFKTEPLPADSKIWNTKNLLITPHVAGNLTLEHTLNVNVDLFCENLVRYGKGLPLNNLIDKNKGY